MYIQSQGLESEMEFESESASSSGNSSGSSGQVRGGKKHEFYVAAFSGHLFYDLFSQGQMAMAPLPPPRSATGK